MAHQHCVSDLWVEVSNVDLVVCASVRAQGTHASSVVLGLVRAVGVVLMTMTTVSMALAVAVRLSVTMSMSALWVVMTMLGWCVRGSTSFRFACTMRGPVELETSLRAWDCGTVQTVIDIFRDLMIRKLDESIAFKNYLRASHLPTGVPFVLSLMSLTDCIAAILKELIAMKLTPLKSPWM